MIVMFTATFRDSNMDARLAAETAKIGLKGISFTDHLDYDYPDYDDVFDRF